MDARMGGMVLGLFGGMVGIAATMFAVAGGLVAWWGSAIALTSQGL